MTQPKPTHRPTTLEEAQEYFRLLVAGVREHAVFLMDKGGHIKTWNAGAQIIQGYRAEEIIGQHVSKFYLPEEVAAGKPARELVIAEKDGHYREEGWRVRKDGSLFWANVLITTLRDDSGNVVGFAKVTRDLTERRAAEE